MSRSHIIWSVGFALVYGIAVSGCGGTREIVRADPETAALLDSCRAETGRLIGMVRTAEDSLHFYRDVDSGQYWRDRRSLLNELDRLRYQLAVAQDSAAAPADVLGETVGLLAVDDLFNPGTADLTAEGEQLLSALGEHLRRRYPWGRIRVEGHADDRPVGGSMLTRWPSNWELAAGRASAVAKYLYALPGLGPERFEVVSFGPYQPRATNDTAQGRARNRRIRVAVVGTGREREE